jgi:hypothetical protein
VALVLETLGDTRTQFLHAGGEPVARALELAQVQ